MDWEIIVVCAVMNRGGRFPISSGARRRAAPGKKLRPVDEYDSVMDTGLDQVCFRP